MCPHIFGQDDVKEAIALQLFGGIAKEYGDGSSSRGDIHILLIGDPGIAKSKILKYITKLSPRSIYVSASSGTTGAGLTATAVKDEFGEGRWTLEAGALVLADMGLASIDELDKMRPYDRVALLEAMEQQTISVAKAGLTVALKSRCSLLAAANPKFGRFDEFVNIAEQFNLDAPLLSRFDLIFLIKDKANEANDKRLAEHLLNLHSVGTDIIRKIKGISKKQPNITSIQAPIDATLLRKYITFAKQNCFPVFNNLAKTRIVEFYSGIRIDADRAENKPVPITARQLEALIRLSEASARMRLSNEITEFDVMQAIEIQDRCLVNLAYDAKGERDVDVVATGMSRNTRNLQISIEDVVKLRSAGEKGAIEEEVVMMLVNAKFNQRKVEEQIQKMVQSGILLRPTNNTLRVA